MSIKNIIVQAGGRGSRLRHHTWNKPKCLVSVNGKPLLYHLFDKFPESEFIVIGDYLFEQLESYLKVNPPTNKITLIKTDKKGTASGISEALRLVDPEDPVLITWSDLIIHELPEFPDIELPIVITTNAFVCRWTIDNGVMKEIPGDLGIPGIFYFNKSKYATNFPSEGEFVKWFSKNVLKFESVLCNDLEELGEFETIETQNDRAGFSRFFNEVKILENIVEKRAIDSTYNHLIQKEQAWYKSVSDLGFRRIPQIISTEPYAMERIRGDHAYQMNNLTDRERRSVLSDYIDSLTRLHDLGTHPSIDADVQETYITKTLSRVESVAKIIPGFDQKSMTVNGLKCKNVFLQKEFFHEIFQKLNPKYFTPIHGDPTFSNSLIDKNLKVWYIDPRGYFAKPGIWGDPMYDFAKVYYSAVGGYDAFNRRKFKLHIDNETVEIIREDSAFADIGKEIFIDYFGFEIGKIEVLHGLIWLALSGYAKDDIDSVIGSFYLGLYYLEQGMKKL